MKSFQQILLGCLEIPLFMRKGVERFPGDKKSAILSFLVPLGLLIPLSFMAQVNPDLATQSTLQSFVRFLELFILTSALFYTISYFCIQALDRGGEYFRFISGLNWLNLSFFLINLPFLILVYYHIYSFAEMQNLLIFLTLFAVVCNAFFTTYILRINWMLATSLSIMSLLIEDSIQKAIMAI